MRRRRRVVLAASLGAALSFMIAAFVNAFEGESPAPWIAGMFAASSASPLRTGMTTSYLGYNYHEGQRPR